MILFIHSTMKYRIELQILNIDFIGAPTHSMTMPGCICTYHSNFYQDRHNIVVSQVQPHNFHVLFFFSILWKEQWVKKVLATNKMLAQRLLTHIPDNFEHPTHLTGGYFSRETGYDKLPFNCNEHKNPFSALRLFFRSHTKRTLIQKKKAVFLIQCNFIQDNLSNFTNDSISMLNVDVFAFGYIHTEKIYLIK